MTEILAKYDATILDIGQADIHNTLSLGILCKTEEQHSGFIMKELLFKASSLGVTVRFYPITTKEYEDWVNMQGKNRYILTLLGRKLSARQISAVTRILAEQGMNIDAIKRLTGRIPLDECESRTRACIEFSVRGTPKDRIAMQEQLMKLEFHKNAAMGAQIWVDGSPLHFNAGLRTSIPSLWKAMASRATSSRRMPPMRELSPPK